MTSDRDQQREREARDTLERAKRDSESLGTSSMARAGEATAQGLKDHFLARDAIGDAEGGGTDPVEVWGRRIGRSLSLVGVVVLTYLLGQQLRLW